MRESLMRMALRQSQAFHVVCESRSYNRVTEGVALAQPAVSLQIRQLEELVDQSLLEYVSKELYLTDAVKAPLKISTDLFQRLENLDMQLSDPKGSLQGQLHLVVESSVKCITPHLSKTFQNLHPEISLSLMVADRTQVIKHLVDNCDDLVVMSLVPQDMALKFLLFLNGSIIAAASPDHPLCNAAKLTLKDLEPLSLLVREPGSGAHKTCEEFSQQRRTHSSQTQEITSLEPLCERMIAGLGLALLPRCVAHQELASGLLCGLSVEESPLYRSWYLVHTRGRRLSPVTRVFVVFVREERTPVNQFAGCFVGPGGLSWGRRRSPARDSRPVPGADAILRSGPRSPGGIAYVAGLRACSGFSNPCTGYWYRYDGVLHAFHGRLAGVASIAQ